MRIARLIVLVLMAVSMLAIPVQSRAQVGVRISVQIGPPALPVYEQPVCPGYGYIWTPGYWAYGNDGYFWVPGTWVQAPVGLLWTPGYWGWEDGSYVWYPGYWGPEVGFYGGVFYGFGYVGTGYEGGYWNHGALYYNRSVNNITNVTNITNVYNKTVVNNMTVNNVSYNGGHGGIAARPTSAEQAATRAPHTSPMAVQREHEHAASTNRAQFASVNQGKPGIAATARPAEFTGRGVVTAKMAAPYHRASSPASGRNSAQPERSNRPNDPAATPNPRPSNERPTMARPDNHTGNVNPQLEQRHQQELQKLQQEQNQEQQRIQQKHQQEQQKIQQRGADQGKMQEIQQKQQQQMQQLEQKYAQQQQQLEQKQAKQQQLDQRKQQDQRSQSNENRPPER